MLLGSCAVTMGCDQVTRASMLQIRDTAARAVEMCVGPQGQSPAQSFDALAFFEDHTRSDWWVTIGRADDVLYYRVEVEHSLEVFRVRTEATVMNLLVWVCFSVGEALEVLANTALTVLSISFKSTQGERDLLVRTKRRGRR